VRSPVRGAPLTLGEAKWLDSRCLEGLAGLALRDGKAERAVRLLGAATVLGGRRLVGRWIGHPAVEDWVVECRNALGGASFQATWEEGRTMTRDQAIAYTLADRSPGDGE
jgi:hypothetical protein